MNTIERYLVENGITKRKLCEIAEIAVGQLDRVIKGRRVLAYVILNLSQILNTSMDNMVEEFYPHFRRRRFSRPPPKPLVLDGVVG